MVEAPWVALPLALENAARRMPFGSMPLLVQKVRSSAAIAASCIDCGMSASGIDSRFCSANRPTLALPPA